MDPFSYYGPQAGIDVLLHNEPIVVLPGTYQDEVFNSFDYVFTPYDILVERGMNFHKVLLSHYDFPMDKDYSRPIDLKYARPISQRKAAICMINGNKASRISGEIYSKRLEIAAWFASNSSVEFDVYGRPPFPLPNYIGTLSPYWKKFAVLGQYCFSLAFENIYHPVWSRGYFSERMTDCFMCGTVPIYYGCYNIEHVIPSGCFIDFRKFSQFAELENYIRNITEREYRIYIENIKDWVNDGNLSRWSFHRTYDKLLALVDSNISEDQLDQENWNPGLNARHSKMKMVCRSSAPNWNWEELASFVPSEKIMNGEFRSHRKLSAPDAISNRVVNSTHAGAPEKFAACPVTNTTTDRTPDTVGEFWRLARHAFDAGQSGLAEKFCRRVLEIIPAHEEARLLLENALSVQKWFKDSGDSTLRLEYSLNQQSTVFDVGGYKGAWSEKIIQKYNPYIYIFEPIPQFYAEIREKFKNNPKVLVYNFGLYDKNKSDKISLNGDGSSLYGKSREEIEIDLIDIQDFIRKKNIQRIDLIKINIEGAEYPLLRRMIDQGILKICRDIQIQFHAFFPDARKLRDKIRGELSLTHSNTYNYPFVWENWRHKNWIPVPITNSAKEPRSNIVAVIFSKDRAMQLDAAMNSLKHRCKDFNQIDVKVLYCTSDSDYQKQYLQLQKENRQIDFTVEKNFKHDLLSILGSYDYVLFLVDDNLFFKEFYSADIIGALRNNLDAIGFSLRLGRNTTYCYMLSSPQNLPDFQSLEKNILKFDWTHSEYDYGYPLEVSSSVYRVYDLLPVLKRIDFSNPNTLEYMLDQHKHLFRELAGQLLCFANSVTFCNPINIVQTAWQNRVSNNKNYSAKSLAAKFDQGYRLDLKKYSGFVPNSCHQEVALTFTIPDKSLFAGSISSQGKIEIVQDLTSIIILNFNADNHIKICINSILENTAGRYEIIVVDNASTDGSLDFLRSLPNILLVENKTNIGCPPARAQAMALAKGGYVVFLDNDTVVTPGWLTKFQQYFKMDPQLGLLGPRSNFVSGPQIVPNADYKNDAELRNFAQSLADKNRGQISLTDRLVGFCLAIRRDVIDRIGSIDPQFGKFGFEDKDYTWRAIIAGFHAAIANDVFIHHTGGPQLYGDSQYNKKLMEAWEIFKIKWDLPSDLAYGSGFKVAPILSRPFDSFVHYIPIPDVSTVNPLVFRSEKISKIPNTG
jgi:FkbM family methyltransferase